MTHFLLRYENPWAEKFYFVALGEEWKERPGFFPVSQTTTISESAAQFPCLASALEVWVKSNRVPGWKVLEMDGDKVIKEWET